MKIQRKEFCHGKGLNSQRVSYKKGDLICGLVDFNETVKTEPLIKFWFS